MPNEQRPPGSTEDQAISDLLSSFDWSDDEGAVAAFHKALIRHAQRAPELLAAVATRAAHGDDAFFTAAAAYALGRAAEVIEERKLPEIERTLVGLARDCNDRHVVEATATALGHLWSRADDDDFVVPLGYVRDAAAALRLAAVQYLALASSVPLPAKLIPVLQRALDDEDEAVTHWAEFGLAYVDGWPDD